MKQSLSYFANEFECLCCGAGQIDCNTESFHFIHVKVTDVVCVLQVFSLLVSCYGMDLLPCVWEAARCVHFQNQDFQKFQNAPVICVILNNYELLTFNNVSKFLICCNDIHFHMDDKNKSYAHYLNICQNINAAEI